MEPESKTSLNQAILGAVIQDCPTLMPILAGCGIMSDLFKTEFHQRIFDLIMSHKEIMDEYPDEIVVLERLMSMKVMDREAMEEWNLMTNVFCSSDRFKLWVNEFVRKCKRKLDAEGYKYHGLIRENSTDEEVVELMAKAKPFFQRSNDLVVDREQKVSEMLYSAEKYINDRIEGIELSPDFEMAHLSDFNKEYGGFHSPQVVVVAARPGMGKTSFMTQAINYNITNNKFGILFTLEMGGSEIVHRMVCQQGQVNSKAVQWHDEPQQVYKKTLEELGPIITSQLDIQDDIFGIQQIEAYCERVNAVRKIGFIAIDYIQLIDGSDPRENRAIQIGEITRKLKLIAKRCKCPVIALCQLNRGSEKENRKPRMSDLRESGTIEQDADIIIFLHAGEKEMDEGNPAFLKVISIIAKWRDCPTGMLPMIFKKSKMSFTNYIEEQGV